MIVPDDLRIIHIFRDLTDEQLGWLADHFVEATYAPGEAVSEKGDPADWLVAVLDGHIQAIIQETGRETAFFTSETGDVGGMLPHSRMTHFPATTRALASTRLGRLHRRHFPEMLQRIPVLDERLTHLMIDRARDGIQARLHREKLTSLGTMSAGLAHELNNPASAAKRAAQNLRDTLQVFDEHASAMLSRVMFKQPDADGDPFQPVYDVLDEHGVDLDPITQGEREDDLADWLEDQGVEESWEIAATLVSVGFTRAFFETFTERLVPEQVINFLNWLPKDVEMRLLTYELAESTSRISDLVAAMKSYSYMDQATVMETVDLHKGLDDTLIILKHKLKKKHIEIARDYGEIPHVLAFGGELNQVWTNLLDNAVAAVPEAGRITVRTRFDRGSNMVYVAIIDNGSGIPVDIQARIFEPFFTTKKAGEGTGLGLDIAYRIVTKHHKGAMLVSSEPGHTEFQVRLPVETTP